jgi:hypothetical protein
MARVGAFLFLLFALPLPAANVLINSAYSTIHSTGGTAFNAKFRASAGNFDQSLAVGSSTSGVNTVSRNVGTLSQISATSYQFTLEHRVGQGLVFTLVSTVAGTNSTVAFGTGFFPGLPLATTTTATTLVNPATSTAIGVGALPSYNSLRIEARASQAYAGAPDELLTWSGMSFSSPTLTVVDGSFSSGSTSPTTPGSASGEVVGGVPTTAGTGFYFQRLASTAPLELHNWTLSGTVHLMRNGTGGDETMRFIISGQQINWDSSWFAAAPEPSRVVLLLAGTLAMLLRRRRA